MKWEVRGGLIAALMCVTSSVGAVDIPSCSSGSTEKRLVCLEQNIAKVNRTLELVAEDVRARLDKVETRLGKVEERLDKLEKKPIDNGWDVGCGNGICAAVNATGQILYFDGSNFTTAGNQLPGQVVPPVSIACHAGRLQNQDVELCWAIDAAGKKWRGPLRPIGQPFVGPY